MDAIERIKDSSGIGQIKPETALGCVKISEASHWGFAANEPRWYQGCEDCSDYDLSGNVFNEQGDVLWRANYSLWGELTQQYSEHNENNQQTPDGKSRATTLRFMGQFYDEESQLHYNRHRYYDPETAQYLSSDPIGLAGGLTPQAYVHNPTGWVDPLGLSGCPCEKNKKTTYDGESRSDAFREAKRDARISQAQQPHEISRVDLDDGHGNKIINSDGNIVKARQYHYKNIDGESIVIQEHGLGHTKATAGHCLEPHFNVRPASNLRTRSVPGTHGHYNF